jgi:hypothetical protein
MFTKLYSNVMLRTAFINLFTGVNDKKIMEYGFYLFIILFCRGSGVTLYKFIGLYIPAFILLLRIFMTNRIYIFWRSPIFIFLICFFFSGILSTLFAIHPLDSLIYFEKYHLRSVVIFIIIVTIFNSEKMLDKLLKVLALSCILSIITEYAQVINTIMLVGDIRYTNISSEAYALLYLLPFIYIATVSSNKRMSKNPWQLIALLSMLGVFLGGSRTAMLGLIAFISVLAIFSGWKIRVSLFFAVILVLLVFAVIPAKYAKGHYKVGFDAQGRTNLTKDYFFSAREHKLGVGLDMDSVYRAQAEAHIARTGNPLVPHRGDPIYHAQKPHGLYTLVVVTQGFPGLFIFVILIIISAANIKKRISCKMPLKHRVIGVALLSHIIGVFMVTALQRNYPMMNLGVLLGIIVVYLNITKKYEQTFDMNKIN